MVKVKLIGALSYSCPSKGIMSPIRINETMEVDQELGEHLLRQTYKDPLGAVRDMFSEDEDAEATYVPPVKEMDLEESIKKAKAENVEKPAPTPAKRTRNKGAPAPGDAKPAKAPAKATK